MNSNLFQYSSVSRKKSSNYSLLDRFRNHIEIQKALTLKLKLNFCIDIEYIIQSTVSEIF